MKYVSVTCSGEHEKLMHVIQHFAGRVVFVDRNDAGIPGTAVGYGGPFCCELGCGKKNDRDYLDLCLASKEKTIKYVSKKSGAVEGVGDVVARVTRFFGIKSCGGCEKRRQWLNKKMPLGI